MEKIIKEIKLSRGLLIEDDKVLLVQDIRPGQGHYFLPGGNVELGESIKETLPREWQEELGWAIEVQSFLGCLEHRWSYNRKQDDSIIEVVEVNFLFLVSTSKNNLIGEPKSREEHLKFSWIKCDALSNINLLPTPLKEIIPNLVKSSHNALWVSTL